MMARVAIVGLLVTLAATCLLAAVGFTAIIGPLVTLFVLFALIAGGNLLGPPGRRS